MHVDVIDGREVPAGVEIDQHIAAWEQFVDDHPRELFGQAPSGSPGKTRFRFVMSSGVFRVSDWNA